VRRNSNATKGVHQQLKRHAFLSIACLGLACFTAADAAAAHAPSTVSGSPASGVLASAERPPQSSLAGLLARSSTDGASSSGLPAAAINSELLKGLIAQANQEGSVSVETLPVALPASDSVKNAFLQYFKPMGLGIDVQFAAEPSQTTVWANAQDAINRGSAPQFDLLLGNGAAQVYPFESITTPIDNWQELLQVVNPDAASGRSKVEDYSPAPFTGQALLFCDYYSVLVYSTQVSTDSLPNKLSDLADPQYKGRYVVAPYSSDSLLKLAVVYGNETALELAQGIGANEAGVESIPAGIQDILARRTDFQVVPLDTLLTEKALNADVPLDYRWFTDITPLEQQFYAVPQNSAHPAAATLFALWATTDAARTSFAPDTIWLNLSTGHTANDEAVMQTLNEAQTEILSLTSTEGLPTLRFLNTPQGKAYSDALNRALTQGGGSSLQEQRSLPAPTSSGGK
jgi:ABC-type Fe3+ transport system substrate-binding protein